ncbi:MULTISPECIES: phosphopantetheine-binding protein [Pandoraea]|uniref:Acyl carrier protein n=1 Tax=Pandoraea cepalis TaxID=2508294 RepID=A0A5E4U9K1_9BURK|nr:MULTISPECIES: phosphopantetheine-binding protein [Pandoraea]QBC33900.1 acyl carrier protein [Pandoraea sp. XY-2]VVD96726.1 Acyl carrier protein [Pandoraea cepalis]
MASLELEIKQLIVQSLELEDIAVDDIADDIPLFGDGLGLDSIDALELGIALRKRFGLQIEAGDDAARAQFRSVATLAQLLRDRGCAQKETE